MNPSDHDKRPDRDPAEVDPQLTDLEWDAYRYLLEEMTRDESDRFEQQLAEDPATRDALTGAMRLTEDIELVESLIEQPVDDVPKVSRPIPAAALHWRIATWVSLSACICLIVGWMTSEIWRTNLDAGTSDDVADAEFNADEEDPALADAWVEMFDMRATTETEDPGWDQLLPGSDEWLQDESWASHDGASAPGELSEDTVDEDETGSWMVVALSGLEDFPDENGGEFNEENLQ